jgi:predicted Zn-dependent protease with MMP-like domain
VVSDALDVLPNDTPTLMSNVAVTVEDEPPPIAELGPRFGTTRMVSEYVDRLYLPAHDGAL